MRKSHGVFCVVLLTACGSAAVAPIIPVTSPTLLPSSLVFTTDAAGADELFALQGPHVVRVTDNSTQDGSASWAYNQLVFNRAGANNTDIWILDRTTGTQTNLTNSPEEEFSPVWSPDRTRIAFVRQTLDGNSDIWVMNADGSAQEQLTQHAAIDGAPTWSPEGDLVAFHSNRDGQFEIYVTEASALNAPAPRRITDDETSEDIQPSWTDAIGPAGAQGRIAWAKVIPGVGGDIWTAERTGYATFEFFAKLTNGSSLDASPEWSPDGNYVAFERFADPVGGPSAIYVIDVIGGNQIPILESSSSSFRSPSWQHLARIDFILHLVDSEAVYWSNCPQGSGDCWELRFDLRVENLGPSDAPILQTAPGGVPAGRIQFGSDYSFSDARFEGYFPWGSNAFGLGPNVFRLKMFSGGIHDGEYGALIDFVGCGAVSLTDCADYTGYAESDELNNKLIITVDGGAVTATRIAQ